MSGRKLLDPTTYITSSIPTYILYIYTFYMIFYAYIVIILMFLNVNFQYIKIPVLLHNYYTKNCLRFTTWFFYNMLIMYKNR